MLCPMFMGLGEAHEAAGVGVDDLVAQGGLYARLNRLNYASFDDLAAGEGSTAAVPSGT